MSATTPKKAKKASKPKSPAAHPKYAVMVTDAIAALKERTGSSRQKILQFVMKNYNVGKDEKFVNNCVKMCLRSGVKNGTLKQMKGAGASGSFRIAVKPAAPKKPKATKKKAASPKKKAVKKAKPAKRASSKPKKAKSPKKASKPKKKPSKPSKKK